MIIDIDEGADVDARIRWWSSDTVLNLAVQRGNLQIVTFIIEAGANIDAMNGWRQTPLMIAAEAGDVDMVRLLIKSGANVNMSNNWDNAELLKPNTALIAASWYGHSDVAQLLIEAGADVHYRGDNGDTALDWAIDGRWGDDPIRILETVVVLVRAGADGPRALGLLQGELYLMEELAEMLHEAGATNPFRLIAELDYSAIAE